MLERHGLRATRPRISLAKMIFGKGSRHVTADQLVAEAKKARAFVSLATVYNVLHLFTDVGLVRCFAVEGGKTIFDTNIRDHCHFYFEDTGAVEDEIATTTTFFEQFRPPEGFEITGVDVVIKLRSAAPP